MFMLSLETFLEEKKEKWNTIKFKFYKIKSGILIK